MQIFFVQEDFWMKKANTVTWKGIVTIENIESKKKELLKVLKKADTVTLDIAELDTIDLTAIQLIVSTIKYSKANGKKFSINQNIPQPVYDFCNLIGIDKSKII